MTKMIERMSESQLERVEADQVHEGQRVTYLPEVSSIMSAYTYEVIRPRGKESVVMTEPAEKGGRQYVRLQVVGARRRRPFRISAFLFQLTAVDA